jgi:hypothetical protein
MKSRWPHQVRGPDAVVAGILAGIDNAQIVVEAASLNCGIEYFEESDRPGESPACNADVAVTVHLALNIGLLWQLPSKLVQGGIVLHSFGQKHLVHRERFTDVWSISGEGLVLPQEPRFICVKRRV